MNFANVKEWRIPVNGNIREVYEVVHNNITLWEKQTTPDYTEPFYVENISDYYETLRIKKLNSYAPTLDIEYLNDTTWEPLCTTSTTEFTKMLQPGEKVYLRCNTSSWWGSGAGTNNIYGISKVGGNIMSLLYGNNFRGNETSFPTNNGYEFYRGIFYGGSSSTKLVDASKLLLPATTLNKYCYYGLFASCSLLTSAPALPATTLVDHCYYGMFSGCVSLNSVECLATDISASNCTTSWLSNVSSTGTFTKAAGVTWPTGASGIPSGWTVEEV